MKIHIRNYSPLLLLIFINLINYDRKYSNSKELNNSSLNVNPISILNKNGPSNKNASIFDKI